jgi:hypothetical protein
MAAKPPEIGNDALPSARRWFGTGSRRPSQAAASATGRSRFGFSRRYTKGDLLLFASGIVLSAFCAFFPWYVFYNQDQFGIRAVTLGNIPPSGPAPRGARPADRLDTASLAEENLETDVDTFTTGTTPPSPAEDDVEPPVAEQPFPAPVPEFELVHVTNGRAMIQDDQGLYVVQRGSLLPDNSRVAKIEKRDGEWVVVTTADRVLKITR